MSNDFLLSKLTLKIFIHDLDKGDVYLPQEGLVNYRQFRVMCTQPEMILQFAHYLKDNSKIENIKITAENYHAVNGRPLQLKISRDVDLAKINKNDNYLDWIYPFDQKL